MTRMNDSHNPDTNICFGANKNYSPTKKVFIFVLNTPHLHHSINWPLFFNITLLMRE